MRKPLFFLSLLASMAFIGCQNDDDPVTGGNDKTEDGFIAFNIVTSTGTRAEAGDFEDGTTEESAAPTGTFLFFDAAGNATQTPQTADLTWTDQGNTLNPALTNKSQAIVVIAGNTAPTQVLVLLNAPSVDFTNKSLDEVRAIVGDYMKSGGNFVMTNSVYQGAEKGATDIAGKTYKSKSQAEENPVDVYVERVAAKVTTTAIGDDFTQDVTINYAGTEKTLSQRIEGIEIANATTASYLVKNISGNANYAEGWNDAANFRSYWATMPADADYDYANQSWNQIDATDPGTAQTFYTHENTSDTKTSVLVTATLLDEDGQPFTFLRWAGNYYDKATFLTQYAHLISNEGFRVKTTEGGDVKYSTLSESNLAWLTNEEHAALVNAGTFKGWEMTAKVSSTDLEIVKADGTDYAESSIDAINNFLKEKAQRVWIWEGGKCYYFKNIAHLEGFGDGIVRNHVYKLTLNSLTGVGVPVFNPDEVIIPEIPSDDLFYLAARINILKWRIVSQTVDFDINY